MGWFILAEALLFLGFFAAYWFIRLSAPAWPPAGSVPMPTVIPAVMTVLLVSSSFTYYAAEAAHERVAASCRRFLSLQLDLALQLTGDPYEPSELEPLADYLLSLSETTLERAPPSPCGRGGQASRKTIEPASPSQPIQPDSLVTP